ncbi:MAG: hypothetical protein IPM16_12640 [Chloroflexi bacterium]|nr:hypothetical protein [Chloroflexota bacterium]
MLDAHSQSAINPRFLTMYAGADVDGNQSPITRYVSAKDYGTRPLGPDPNLPYYGPGYKLDFPGTAGNCAACHTPMAAANAPYGVDPRQVAGVDAEGIGCDFCHKVWSVSLDARTGLPYANMPGVLSYAFRRPDEGHQFFAGPFDDVAPGEDTYSAVQTESAFCAPCHYGVFWDTVVYDSFGEWLASPYSDPITGQTCQDCHMPRLGVPTFALPEQGGLVRDSQTIYSHRMPGAPDTALLEATLELAVVARRDGEQLYVHVDVANAGAGHHVPTDSPLRQVLLTVSVADPDMMPVDLLSGPVLPSWSGDLAGHPGLYFAKILQERWTELYPSGAYWMPTRIREDTRLPALGSTTADFVFGTTGDGPVHVEVRAVLRRAFYDLMQQKGWTQPDIEMERVMLRVP